MAILRRRAATVEELSSALGVSPGRALDACLGIRDSGANLRHESGVWVLHDQPTPAFISGAARHELVSDANNCYRFGVVADSHLGSKYERLDALSDIYNRFEREGITHVYHCGNWIEGEARFNRTDIKIHGMDAQLQYLVDNYPRRSGITTYAVSGDDHEGWYNQREALDIGRRAQQDMRAAGRNDWVDLGFMEAHVNLMNANTGKHAVMAVVHPGGGAAYAESYVVQKIIESLDGGEKPAVALYGHYHKCLAGEYRNVWWVLVPSTKDQDCFMRKKRIRSVVGGGIIALEQDPETGAIIGMTPKLWRYFNRGYYDGRWSHSGDVVLPERSDRVG
jgi:predicted phosphodiesterase